MKKERDMRVISTRRVYGLALVWYADSGVVSSVK